jgi:hypothetical protein
MRASEFVPTLRALESADDHKDPLRHQVRFCARWSLDNMCTLAFMAEGCVKEGLAETDTPLWARCCVCVWGGHTVPSPVRTCGAGGPVGRTRSY